ncbi:unnamed protein product [Auanema sp. JU1783]|nr:unnamed protein product [Auanema sp. JU1783]
MTSEMELICPNLSSIPPSWYTKSSFSIGFLTIFTGLYAVFLIVKYSPASFRQFKWYLLAYQISSSVATISASILVVPVILYPGPIASSRGLLNYMNIPLYTQILLDVGLHVAFGAIILILFIYRHAVLNKIDPTSVRFKSYCFLFFVGACSLYCVIGAGSNSEGEKVFTREELVKQCPELEEWDCSEDRLVLLSPYLMKNRLIPAIFVLQFVLYSISLVYMALFIFKFCDTHSCMSIRTRKMQMNLLLTLTLQASIPFILITLIMTICIVAYTFQFAWTGFSCAILFLICECNGIATAFSLILVNDAYRNEVKQILLRTVKYLVRLMQTHRYSYEKHVVI